MDQIACLRWSSLGVDSDCVYSGPRLCFPVSFWREGTTGSFPISPGLDHPAGIERDEGRVPLGAGEPIEADLILVHAPSIFDFRGREDIFHANLSTSDCGVTPVYEMYPLGFKSIQKYLGERGQSVQIINLASLMLRFPALDVPTFLSRLNAKAFGIDLHWMVHVQGSLEVASELKKLHRRTPTIFGGISATYYADELMLYPQVDMVLRGYDTLAPLSHLMSELASGAPDLARVPNLCYKDSNRVIHRNEFSYLPDTIPGIDWSAYKDRSSTSSQGKLRASPYVFTLTSTGCAHNCPWCGGSRDAYMHIMGRKGRTVMYKPLDELVHEVESIGDASNSGMFIYALQWYCEPKDRIIPLAKAAKKAGIEKMQFEVFNLTPLDTVAEVCQYIRPTFNLSPQSHDIEISRLSGRGTYTMEQMEAWIEKVLPLGVQSVNVWFFVGMEKQTPQSVFDTVEYCKGLLQRFRGKNVVPVICPMIPFLDPGSTFFVEPEKHGYRIFHRSVEEHRKAMLSLKLSDRMNYETKWMSRSEIVYTSYEAVKRLVVAKGEIGMIPRSLAEASVRHLDRTVDVMRSIDHALSIQEPPTRDAALAKIREQILDYNQRTLSGRTDQIFPAERSLDGRWFDEFEFIPEAS